MSTIIYLGNKLVQFVEGNSKAKFSVTKNLTLQAPEGAIINGLIMDQDAFAEFLKNAINKHRLSTKEVILVVNSTKFVGQSLELPKMNDKAVMGYIRREFTDIDKDSDRVYGFIRMGDADRRLQGIYSESIAPDYLKEYVDFFGNMGIKLKSIYSAETNLINFVDKTIAKKHDNFMLLIAGSMTLTTILFSEKKFLYYNSSRCFHEPGTEEYAVDMARSVSQIGQFMKANQIDKEPEHIFLAGINREDMPMYREAIGQVAGDKKVDVFEGRELGNLSDRDAQHFLFALGGLYPSDASADYLRQLKLKKLEKREGKHWKYIYPVIITAAVMSAALVASIMYVNSKKAYLSEVKNINAASAQKTSYEQALEENVSLVSDYALVGELNENLEAYPVPGSYVAEALQGLGDGLEIYINSYSGDSGQLELTVIAAHVTDITDYIAAVKKETIVKDVVYTGYTSIGDKGYRSNISIVLSEKAGREELK